MQRGSRTLGQPQRHPLAPGHVPADQPQQFIDLIYRATPSHRRASWPLGSSRSSCWTPRRPRSTSSNDLAEAKKLISTPRLGHQQGNRHPYLSGNLRTSSRPRSSSSRWRTHRPQDRIEVGNAGEFLPRSNRGEYDIFTGTPPRYDSPQAPMRQNHSDSRLAFGGTRPRSSPKSTA